MIIGEYNDTFPPHIDGVGVVVKNYVQALSDRGNDCYYIAPENRSYEGETSFKALLYAGIKLKGEAYHLGLPLIDVPYLRQVNNIPFDIIHAHSPFSAGMEALRVSRLRRVPLVSTFHSKYYDDFYIKTNSHTVAAIAVRRIMAFYDKCDEVWTVSESTAEVLRRYGYKRNAVIVPNGTDLSYPTKTEQEDAARDYGLGDAPALLFVGQINWKKNLRHIIDALKLFSEKSPFRALIVGQGPDMGEVRAYVHSLSMDDSFVFTGQIGDRERLAAIYARCDLLVFPSLYDNAPMVVREAAAAGTPSVLARGSCAAEGIAHGDNGFLCDDTPESICETIRGALPGAKAAGVRARETIPLRWSAVIDTVSSRYETLIEQRRKAR